MKKLGLLVMPLMAISLLASCEQPKQVVQHFVTFESNGGSHISTQRVDEGGVATDPGASTKPGYDFKGWYTTDPNPTPIEDDKYNFDTKVTDDITLYAGWTSVDIKHYNFSLNGTGCTIFNDPQYKEENIEEGSNRKFTIVPSDGYKLPLTVTIAEGSECATYSDETITIANMNSDVVATASATPIETITHTITFNGTSPLVEKDVEEGSYVTEGIPEVPTKQGFTPIGWCTDQDSKNVFDFSKVKIYQDYDLYPGYTKDPDPIPTYTITFNGTSPLVEKDVEEGSYVTEGIPEVPTKSGYTPIGWCTDEAGTKLFDFETVKIYQDYDLYPGYTPIPVPDTYTITFNPNGGTLDAGSTSSIDEIARGTNFYEIEGIENQKATHNDKDHYSFIGWGLSPNTPDKISDTYEVTNSFTAYAIYNPLQTATIKLSNDSNNCTLHYKGVSYNAGSTFNIPAGTDVSMTIETNEGYLPVFQNNVTFAGEHSSAFDSIKHEVTVNVDASSTCTISASTTLPKEKLDDYSWPEISQISKMGLASTYFKVYDPNDRPELSTKKLQLKHQSGDIYQTVKIIGLNEDYTVLPIGGGPRDPSKAIGITFEFADILSDANGYSLASYWNDVANKDGSNYNYMDSTIRAALNGTYEDPTQGSTKPINWFQYFGTEHDEDTNKHFTTDTKYVGKSVLEMLPDELSEVLATPSKYINIYNSKLSKWEEKTVEDKLFLLSPKEMGDTQHTELEEPDTTTYSYYVDTSDYADIRIKHQIKGNVGARNDPLSGYDELEGNYKGLKYVSAGFEDYYTGTAFGGYTMTRSPDKSSNDSAFSIATGYSTYFYCTNAHTVAPAFCI